MLHSIYDLTTFCRQTGGDVPAKLVGASTTVVGSKMYLFGGRLVTERRMVSDLYVFDLETFLWEKIPVSPEDDVPKPRYFHSADAWSNQLIIFGGMSNQPDSTNPDELCVLNDVRFFDLATRRWLPPPASPVPVSDSLIPRARYAHLSSITADRLFIIGGQDFYNTWLDDVCVYDLLGKTWVQRRDYPRHCGTYRSVAVASNMVVRIPQDEMRASHTSAALGTPGARFSVDGNSPPSQQEFTQSESLVHLPYSATPSEEHPSDIHLYSNYNFTDVKRELEVFSPLPDTDFTIQDRSAAMSGTSFPPGLRFPTGAILGTHLIIAGTYLAHSYQSFSIWVLDLITMTWSRIDPGKAVETGSWFRGCLWAEANKFLIFGNRKGKLVDDYNRRLLSWDDVAVVDLEAFGIYQPPPLKMDVRMQELGLAALEEKVLTDFELVCDDGRKIACSRKLLEDRWPWFKEQRAIFERKARSVLDTLPSSNMHVALPDLPAALGETHVDPRLTPRAFYLSEPYPITLALLQYFYSFALVTPLQHAPAVLRQLLVLATNYQIDHLAALVKHAMHRGLSDITSVGVYEVATLCSCRSLQIRALKTVMSFTQKRPSRKTDRGGGGSRDGDGASGGTNGINGNADKYARPRGTSDAKWRTNADMGASYQYTSRVTSMQTPTALYHPSKPLFIDDEPMSASDLFTLPTPRRTHFSGSGSGTDTEKPNTGDSTPRSDPGESTSRPSSSRSQGSDKERHPHYYGKRPPPISIAKTTIAPVAPPLPPLTPQQQRKVRAYQNQRPRPQPIMITSMNDIDSIPELSTSSFSSYPSSSRSNGHSSPVTPSSPDFIESGGRSSNNSTHHLVQDSTHHTHHDSLTTPQQFESSPNNRTAKVQTTPTSHLTASQADADLQHRRSHSSSNASSNNSFESDDLIDPRMRGSSDSLPQATPSGSSKAFSVFNQRKKFSRLLPIGRKDKDPFMLNVPPTPTSATASEFKKRKEQKEKEKEQDRGKSPKPYRHSTSSGPTRHPMPAMVWS